MAPSPNYARLRDYVPRERCRPLPLGYLSEAWCLKTESRVHLSYQLAQQTDKEVQLWITNLVS